MPECIFTCPRCRYQVSWNNDRENQPHCPNCGPVRTPGVNRDSETAHGDWIGKAEQAWRSNHRRLAAQCYVRALQHDPDLNSVGWMNLLWESRSDLSGVPEGTLQQLRAIPHGPEALANDSKEAVQARRRLLGELAHYIALPDAPAKVAVDHEQLKKVGVVNLNDDDIPWAIPGDPPKPANPRTNEEPPARKPRSSDAAEPYAATDGETANQFIVPLLVEAAPPQRTKKCRFCAEEIAIAATKCKHCGEWLQRPPGMPGTQTGIKVVPPANAVIFTIITLGLYQLFWLYRVFKELHTRRSTVTTPGQAVGFLFIPFFNFVWVFIVWKRLADAVAREYANARLPLPATGLVWLAPIGMLIGFFLNLALPGAGSVIILILLPISVGNAQAWMNQLASISVGASPVRANVAAVGVEQLKSCPTCGESLPFQALHCRYCGQRFSQQDVALLQQRNEELAAQTSEQLGHRSLSSRKTILQVFGISMTVIGGLLLLLMIAVFFSPPAPGNTAEQQRFAAVFCAFLFAVPPICVGIFLIARAAKVKRDLAKVAEPQGKTKG